MSTDNKTKAPTSCPPKKKCRYSEETMSKIKLRRRDLYKQLPVDKKELLLSQRRLKERESKTHHVLVDYSEEESLFQAGVNLRKQRTLTINEPSSVGNKVDISAFDKGAIDSDKEKNDTNYLSVFELGSTSGAPCEEHDAEPSAVENKAASLEAHVPKLRGNLKKGKSIYDAPTIRETAR